MKKVRWRPYIYVVALIFLSILLFGLPYTAEGIAKFERVAIFTLVAVTMTYAIFVYGQAEASKRMAEEMMQQRYGDVLPIVDIQKQDESAKEKIRKGLDIESGKIPEGQLCTLRSIGLGPAINVCSFIRTPTGERRQWDFGTLAANDETDKERLSIEQRSGRGVLVAYYKDVYDQPFESSREVIVDKERRSYKIGSLKIRKLTEEEYTIVMREG